MIVLARVSVLKRHLGFFGAGYGHNNRFLLESRIASVWPEAFFLASMAESNDNVCSFGPSPLLKKVCAMLQQTNTIYQLPCDCLKRDVSQMASPAMPTAKKTRSRIDAGMKLHEEPSVTVADRTP